MSDHSERTPTDIPSDAVRNSDLRQTEGGFPIRGTFSESYADANGATSPFPYEEWIFSTTRSDQNLRGLSNQRDANKIHALQELSTNTIHDHDRLSCMKPRKKQIKDYFIEGAGLPLIKSVDYRSNVRPQPITGAFSPLRIRGRASAKPIEILVIHADDDDDGNEDEARTYSTYSGRDKTIQNETTRRKGNSNEEAIFIDSDSDEEDEYHNEIEDHDTIVVQTQPRNLSKNPSCQSFRRPIIARPSPLSSPLSDVPESALWDLDYLNDPENKSVASPNNRVHNDDDDLSIPDSTDSDPPFRPVRHQRYPQPCKPTAPSIDDIEMLAAEAAVSLTLEMSDEELLSQSFIALISVFNNDAHKQIDLTTHTVATHIPCLARSNDPDHQMYDTVCPDCYTSNADIEYWDPIDHERTVRRFNELASQEEEHARNFLASTRRRMSQREEERHVRKTANNEEDDDDDDLMHSVTDFDIGSQELDECSNEESQDEDAEDEDVSEEDESLDYNYEGSDQSESQDDSVSDE